jgi:membrane-bound lytic murein transglycosylase D
MKKRNLFISLLICLGTLAFNNVNAQESNTYDKVSVRGNSVDPIAAMLDSLVTINHVVRYNNLEANCFDPNTGISNANTPNFTDDVYRDRINSINSPIPLSYNKHVKGYIDLYASKKRGLTQRCMGLSNLYFPMYEEILDKNGIPLEFKYLSIVESALNPVAVSCVGATGLWQFMYTTGIIYDLKVNSFTDDRKDPRKATEAACAYFKDMYKIYGDWLLVIASYNCGAGNVNKAIRRSGGKKNFWEIMEYLPAETRGYVPAFIAVTYVMNYSREHNLYPIAPAYSYFEVDTVTVNRQVNFSELANSLDLPSDVVAFLNPIYKKNYIPGGNNYTLRLPTNKIALFLSKEEEIYLASTPANKPILPTIVRNMEEDLLANESDSKNDIGGKFETVTKKVKKTHTVKRGENISSIANRYNMTTAELKKSNRLKSTKLKAGQRLTVYTTVKTKVPVKVPSNVASKKDSSSPALAQASKKDITHSGSAAIASNSQNDSTENTAENAEVKSTDTTVTADNVEINKSSKEVQKAKYKYHLVVPGDTLWKIAKRYDGLTVKMIKDINNLHNANIKPGTRLKVIVNG